MLWFMAAGGGARTKIKDYSMDSRTRILPEEQAGGSGGGEGESVTCPEVLGGETVYEELGSPSEVGGTPTIEKRRRHSISGNSPEEKTGRIHEYQEHLGVEGQGYFLKEVMTMVAEAREYVRNDFNRANKETRMRYFEKRFSEIEEYGLLMHVEYKRAREYAERIGSIERGFDRLMKKDWGSDVVREVESEVLRAVAVMTESAKRAMDETLGKMSRKVEVIVLTAQHVDEERERSAKVAEAESKKKLESVVGIVSGLEKRLKSVERFMEEVKENMDRTFVEVQHVGKKMTEDILGMVSSERRTESEVVRLVETLNVDRISTEVAEAKKVMVEVAGVLGDAARRAERMEVDGVEESGGSFAQVVRRRRKQRGPTVVLEAPAEEGGRSQVTREQVVKCLDPRKGEVRVRGLRRQGKDFVVELHGEEDLERLRTNAALGEIGVKVDGAARLRWPRIYVHDVAREIEKEDLLEAVLVRNKELLRVIARGSNRNLFRNS